jgi:DNA-binding CsgD family transcriptional regulator
METGFDYLKKSFRRSLTSLVNSDIPQHVLDSLDDETNQQLIELAEKAGISPNQYALTLLTHAIQQHYYAEDERIALWKTLTRREQEVALLACKEKTNPEIAKELYISEDTVKKHMSSVLRKFNLKGRGMLRWALDGWDFDGGRTPWQSCN